MKILVVALATFVSASLPALAAITVDTTVDGDDGECVADCTLREAIDVASAGEEILLPAGVYRLTLGMLQIDKDLAITGAGSRGTHVAATGNQRALRIDAGAVVTMTALTVRRDASSPFGGGIFNQGTLRLNVSALLDNASPTGLGGGLQNTGSATLNRCVVAGNASEFGGGVFNSGQLIVNNSTISGNESAFDGAGILTESATTLRNTTVTANNARISGPGGIVGFGITLQNSIVADQVKGADCGAGVDSSLGYNLDSDGSCLTGGGPGNVTASPLLGPLRNNGGPTDTHAPLPGSPAIDAGNPSAPGGGGDACLSTDQRGVDRPQGGRCDIGAVEVESDPDCETDADMDGFTSCDDCNDADSGTFPGAPQACDGVNNDCSDPAWPVPPAVETDDDGDGAAECQGDCDDGDPARYPGNLEVCDGIDNDCDGLTADGQDETWLGQVCDGPDSDLCDEGIFACVAGAQSCSDETGDDVERCDGLDNDCDPSTSDGAGEEWLGQGCDGPDSDLCLEGSFACEGGLQSCSDSTADDRELCDGLDNDCDGMIPADEADDDGDGFRRCGGDCDDRSRTTFPNAPQRCDGRNNDCADPLWPAVPPNEVDDDGDSFSECQGDCDDSDAAVSPGAPEICDGLDNNCSGAADEGNPDSGQPCGMTDTGECRLGTTECTGGELVCEGEVGPAPEQCDGRDNDCDGELPVEESDVDRDGFLACADDCDDSDPAVNPAVEETCNGIDDDCNGLVDDGPLGVDSDLDGVRNACDNCAEIPNSDQADLDDDDRGDLCDNCVTTFNPSQDDLDSDRVGDACDNCPFDSNTTQTDVDADLRGDPCDLDDGIVYIVFDEKDEVRWQEELGFDSWDLYRGDLLVLEATGVYTQPPGANPLAERWCDIARAPTADPVVPEPGGIAFYLAGGRGDGVEDALGFDSSGTARANDNPCP